MVGDIVKRLVAEYGFREEQGYLRAGRCPSCDDRSLFTRADQPWVVFCNHANKCGWTGAARTLFPDLFDFEALQKRNPATASDPHATARAYLRSRGLVPERFEGWFEQQIWTDQVGPFKGEKLHTI